MKRKKAYKPKYPPGMIPITFRFSAEDERKLCLLPHTSLNKILSGQGDVYDWNTIAARINFAERFVMRFKEPAIKASIMPAMEALRAVRKRFESSGRMGVTGDEFRAMGAVLCHADDMQRQLTRREINDDMIATYKLNAWAKSRGIREIDLHLESMSEAEAVAQ